MLRALFPVKVTDLYVLAKNYELYVTLTVLCFGNTSIVYSKLMCKLIARKQQTNP